MVKDGNDDVNDDADDETDGADMALLGSGNNLGDLLGRSGVNRELNKLGAMMGRGGTKPEAKPSAAVSQVVLRFDWRPGLL